MLFHTVTGSHPRRQLLCIGKRNTPHKTRTCLFHDSLSPHACPAQETQQDTTELRSISEELELNWCFLLRILLPHFQSRELHTQAGCISPQATMLPIPNFKFLFAFRRIS